MQTLVLENVRERIVRTTWLATWFKKNEEYIEYNRFGISAALVLLQVTIAGFNVVIPAMANASIWLMTPGIFMAFFSNSVAFAQMKMKWVLLTFALSMLINAIISIYFFVQLF